MTDPNDGSDEPDRPDETPENPDQHENDSENPTREVRTDGGEVVTDQGQHAHQTPQPHSPETPDSRNFGRSQVTHINTARPTESTNSQTDCSPTNFAEPDSDSETVNSTNGDQLFSGAVAVDDVVEFYLDTNPWDVQPNTVTAYRGRLRHFQAFCTAHDIEDLGTVRPNTLDEFQNYLREASPLVATSSIKGCLAALRKFLQYCERRGVFDHGFHKLVILPTVSKHEGQDERWLARESAEEIVEHLETYRSFTKAHVVWAILAETGIRQSTLYALDLDDYDAEERYLTVVNREESGTRLKNGYDAERELSISADAARAIDGYIQENRNAVTDDHGREPLVTTRNGRLQKSTIRQYVYAWTRPCATGQDCPVGEDPDTCDAAQTNNAAYDCPESLSPHPVRRGYITHLRANGVPTEDVISERCDANPDTIERWYDLSTESDRREARREYVEDL
ncbi:site-specific integrase [Halobacterium salinarum]|uniref:tyrosine-type recombinase/integrase n=1 Tax=Halobacterium salinarum TaxID=2242 RepID=UPI002554F09B|nr:site-specific integrase [Halobacterium salinarum]MDL0138881.1 site-specific integrase [Halobacterium salinarum]